MEKIMTRCVLTQVFWPVLGYLLPLAKKSGYKLQDKRLSVSILLTLVELPQDTLEYHQI
jgi:hypothetical protein